MMSYEHMSSNSTCEGNPVYWFDYRTPGQFTKPWPVTGSSVDGQFYRGEPSDPFVRTQ